jgi:hypothetical protein
MILAAQGHSLMVVKPNQRTLYQDIKWAFAALPLLNCREQKFWDYQRHETHDRGRLERCACWRQDLRTKVITQDVHFGITSLGRQTLAQVKFTRVMSL